MWDVSYRELREGGPEILEINNQEEGHSASLSLLSILWVNVGHGKATSNNVSVGQLTPDGDCGSNFLFCQMHDPCRHRAK